MKHILRVSKVKDRERIINKTIKEMLQKKIDCYLKADYLMNVCKAIHTENPHKYSSFPIIPVTLSWKKAFFSILTYLKSNKMDLTLEAIFNEIRTRYDAFDDISISDILTNHSMKSSSDEFSFLFDV